MLKVIKYTVLPVIIVFFTGCGSSGKTGSHTLDAKQKEPRALMQHEKQVDSLLSLMTLEEKAKLLHASSSFTSGGVERLGIPELVMSDGPHGVRQEHGRDWDFDITTEDSATYMPTGISLASTWNKQLGYEYGKVLGSETAQRKKDVILGPGVNIIRSPLNGRNFEYLSEDPYFTGKMAVGYIRGVQDQGVGACVKHYAANNQETLRGKINAVVSERALHEIYLPAFDHAIEEGGVYTIMTAYNKVNGQYCSENEYLFNVLHKDFGFKGAAVSDWGAVHSTEATLKHGVDIEMGTELANGTRNNPDYNQFYLAEPVVKLVKEHPDYEKYVDEKVKRVLRVMYAVHKFDNLRPKGERNTSAHHQTALKVAEEAVVLLKNKNGILPIKKNVHTIVVIGDNAIVKHAEQGGSSQVKAQYEITPLEAIEKTFGKQSKILFAQGYLPNEEEKGDKKLMTQALELAKQADLVIYVGGWLHNLKGAMWGKHRYDSEGSDKKSYEFPFGQTELLNKLTAMKPTVGIFFGGSFAQHDQWVDQIKAILFVGYPGMEGGTAIAEVLSGKVNPSGKLPFTIARKLEDYPAHSMGEFPGNGKDVVYKDDIWVGYRYFDQHTDKVMFPFGYGLSYTSFKIDNLKTDKHSYQQDDQIKVSMKVSNTGKTDGLEVVQLYVSDVSSSVERPEKELKRFEKVFLKKGESKTLTFMLDKKDFSYWDPSKKEWYLEPGKFKIMLGNSSQNIEQTADITIK
jgi:beta-glucosidase